MPIAIIGISCRFPGDATSPEKLWNIVSESRGTWSEVPQDRFNNASFYHPEGSNLGTSNVRGAHFLKEDVSLFDASFFNFSAEVAASMDPQIRLQLESVFEATEGAGITLPQLAGSKTSVFSAVFIRDYHDTIMRDVEALPRYFLTGNGAAMASNRLSHFFDLRGASVTLDCGCSTALAALHLACQSIRAGEADMSIVGGVNLMLNPDMFITMSSLGLLGADGRSYSFDGRAQGYGRGEGVATLLLKPLEAALRDGDPIRAVIRETALNQDGRTPTITSPSAEAQKELIRACYQRAGLNPLHTAYVETHGTGTGAGDPVESEAIGETMGKGRPADKPLLIGSVKSNIGHLEAASGLAAVIKVVLALENGSIPPNYDFKVGNAKIPFEDLRLRVPIEAEEWPSHLPRRASVNNFGYGGTNAHVIMEDAAYYLPSAVAGENAGLCNGPPPNGEPSRFVFPISAKDEASANAMIANLATYLQTKGPEGVDLKSLAYTLGQKRTKFPWTVSYQASTAEELLNDVTSASRPTFSRRVPRIGFVFNGQGAQWYAMGRELMGAYPVFDECIDEAESHLRSFGAEWSLREELTRDEKSTRVNETRLAMPLSVSIQVALVRLLESWNIKPAAVTGHSSGEISAAFAAGALDLRGAVAIAYFRGLLTDQYLVQDKSTSGGMMAVGLGPEAAEPYLGRVKTGKVVIACINSPSSVTLSGDTTGIDELEGELKAEGVFARKLVVPAAYHSHHMHRLADLYRKALEDNIRVNPSFNGVLFSSPVTGGWISNAEDLGPAHWVKNMVQPVLFAQSLHTMCVGPDAPGHDNATHHVDVTLEIGPHGALAGPIRQSMAAREDLKNKGIRYHSCLTRGVDAVHSMQGLLAFLSEQGHPVDFASSNFPRGTDGLSVVQLPSYPWNHSTRFWAEPRKNKEYRNRKHAPHDLLGTLVPGNPLFPSWRNIIRPAEVPWVRDHVIDNEIVYPAAGQIAMAIEAVRQHLVSGDAPIVGYGLRDVQIMNALLVPDTPQGAEVHITLNVSSEGALSNDWHEFHIYTVPENGEWVECSKGLISVRTSRHGNALTDHQSASFDAHSGTYNRTVEPRDYFNNLRAVKLKYGEIFQTLDSIRCGNGQSIAFFHVTNSAASIPTSFQSAHVIHPITLDALLQAAYSVLTPPALATMGTAVPQSIKSMFVSSDIVSTPGHKFQTLCQLHRANSEGFDVSMSLTDGNETGAPSILEISQVHYQALGIGGKTKDSDSNEEKLCLKMDWVHDMSVVKKEAYQQSVQGVMGPREMTLVEDLKRAVVYFVHDVLKKLTEDDISQLEWYHKTLLEWLRLQETRAANDEITPRSSTWAQANEGIKHRLWDEVAAGSVNGEMAVRIGKNLLRIMRKQVTPLELMMEGKLLYKYYEKLLRINRSFEQVAKLAHTFSRSHPRAKILEIGGGTGAATGPLLRAMSDGDGAKPQFAQYDFTDISSGFFEAARENFGPWEQLMTFKKLDVETNPKEQGFELGSYDLVVACQVLHATKDLTNTMANVHSLLKPGGKLIMVETTQDTIDVQLVFGVLPGWWLSTEPERKYSPNISAEMWGDVLRQVGFSGLDVAVRDCEDERNYAMSVIMSTALPKVAGVYPEDVVLSYSGSSPPQEWLTGLQGRILQETGVTPTIESLDKINPAGKVVVFVSELECPVLDGADYAIFGSVKALLNESKGVLWLTRGATIDCPHPERALHTGLLRTLRLEDSSKRYVALDLDPQEESWSTSSIADVSDIFSKSFNYATDKTTLDFEFAVRDGSYLLPRVSEDPEENIDVSDDSAQLSSEPQPYFQEGRELHIVVGTSNPLNNLVFTDDLAAGKSLDDNFIEIETVAFGLDFSNTKAGQGQEKESTTDFDFSGVVTRIGPGATHDFKIGDRVCAFMGTRGYWAHKLRVHYTSAVKIHDDMSLEAAASIPAAFATAYYALFEKARLEKGETILIHAAAGSIGQAAIILAQRAGAEIFATVGSQEQREHLRGAYGIADGHIFSSLDTSFATVITAATNGHGVDVLLNSLSGDLLQESWNVMAPLGRFVELGKRDIRLNKRLEMDTFDRAVSFLAVDLTQVATFHGKVLSRVLRECLALFETKQIQPIQPLAVYSISEMQHALRTAQVGQPLGKIVVKPSEGDLVNYLPQQQGATLRADASYLIVGGLGGIGISLSRWFVAHGAKNLILLSRSAASQKHSQTLVKELKNAGCRAVVKNCNIAEADDLSRVIQECSAELPPVKGVIQAAMVLRDSIFESMEYTQWTEAIWPKVLGTRNLHTQFGSTLDFFVILSSLTSVLGNATQGNYSAGGAFQDAFARWRTSQGLPAVSINLGAVKSVGYVASEGIAGRMEKLGYIPLEEDEVLSMVEAAIRTPLRTRLENRHSQVITRLARFDSIDGLSWREDPRFSGLRRVQTSTLKSVSGAKKGSDESFRDLLSSAKSLGEAVDFTADTIADKLAEMFMRPITEIDKSQGLGKHGVDSLMAVELRNWIVRRMQTEISIFTILQSPSLTAVAEKAAVKSQFVIKAGLVKP
ncbi:related to type I polyketide synthase [Cephalotrichum gorgonifer]|uniref:Related to type I polyketide synthase n=1 Tax=Cephalotrichum gorgonifer TaxID=2041049 RepID=A0AAE8N3Z6_9PEZI|nr:related to type I polyketide synthase [Cephalotrichum gorgonifer]